MLQRSKVNWVGSKVNVYITELEGSYIQVSMWLLGEGWVV